MCTKPYTYICRTLNIPCEHLSRRQLPCRAPLQILALGYLLAPATRHPSWWWLPPVLSAALVALASLEAVSRPRLGYRGMVRHALLAVAGGTAGGLVYCLLVVLPRWRSQQVCGLGVAGMAGKAAKCWGVWQRTTSPVAECIKK